MTAIVPIRRANIPNVEVEAGALVLRMGRASIVLHEDGRIELMGTQLIQQLTGNVTLSAEKIHIVTEISCKMPS